MFWTESRSRPHTFTFHETIISITGFYEYKCFKVDIYTGRWGCAGAECRAQNCNLNRCAYGIKPHGKVTAHISVCLLQRVAINLCRISEGPTWFLGSAPTVHAHGKRRAIHVELLGDKKVAIQGVEQAYSLYVVNYATLLKICDT
jgi:hypothetical protein